MSINNETYEPANSIDGKEFKKMLYSSLKLLKEKQSHIDSLNVFPVPDGDTGTNMYLTYKEAIEEVKKLDSNRIDKITSALAQGALMGARGNSGVILSQLLRGFSQANQKVKDLNAKNLADGIDNASKIAYQGVLKPVEGTILTVSSKAGEKAQESYEKGFDILGILENSYEAAEKALEKTPDQLPKLKEAGVVDAGGEGYVTLLKAIYKELKGDLSFTHESKLEVIETEKKEVSVEKLKYTYCTQTLIFTENENNINNENNNINIEEIRDELQKYGDSLMVVGSGNLIKIHIHTNHPGEVLEYALHFGNIGDINIDNMERQQEHKESAEVAKNLKKEDEFAKNNNNKTKLKKVEKDIGIISVAKGEGMKNIMRDLGVDIIISGGQSMNPSTNDFVEAIENLDVNKIIILPNNKNIISAAKQSVNLVDKEIAVIETKTIPEAISSLLVFNDQADLADLKEAMEGETEFVKTAEITKAVKDSQVEGLEIKEGDIIGLLDGKIEVHGENYKEVVLKLFKKELEDEDLITIYYGEEVSEEKAQELQKELKEKFNLDEIEIYNGGQPLYPYIISLE